MYFQIGLFAVLASIGALAERLNEFGAEVVFLRRTLDSNTQHSLDISFLAGLHRVCRSIASCNGPVLRLTFFFVFIFMLVRTSYSGSQHWNEFAGQQYFDAGGMFLSTTLCLPILLNLVILTVCWVSTSYSSLLRSRGRVRVVADRVGCSCSFSGMGSGRHAREGEACSTWGRASKIQC